MFELGPVLDFVQSGLLGGLELDYSKTISKGRL